MIACSRSRYEDRSRPTGSRHVERRRWFGGKSTDTFIMHVSCKILISLSSWEYVWKVRWTLERMEFFKGTRSIHYADGYVSFLTKLLSDNMTTILDTRLTWTLCQRGKKKRRPVIVISVTERDEETIISRRVNAAVYFLDMGRLIVDLCAVFLINVSHQAANLEKTICELRRTRRRFLSTGFLFHSCRHDDHVNEIYCCSDDTEKIINAFFHYFPLSLFFQLIH